MPISGLSETVRLPRLGKIRLGIRVNGIPQKTKYFVLPQDHPDYQCLVKQFGEQPTELRIYIPVEDEEKWSEQYYKCYDRTHGLVCKGDGQTAIRLSEVVATAEGWVVQGIAKKDSQTTTMKEIPCAGKNCPEYQSKKCGETMNLRFVLPDAPGIGIWQIDTGSKNSILNINSCARLIKMTFGRISMIPLKLTLEPIEVKNPENGKRQTVYVLNLRTPLTINQLANDARDGVKQLMIGQAELENAWDVEVEQDKDTFYGPEERKETIPVVATTKTPAPVEPSSPVDDFDKLFPPTAASTQGVKAEAAPTSQAEAPKGTEKKQRDLAKLKDSAVLSRWLYEDFGLKISQQFAELGITSWNDLTESPKDAYLRIAATHQAPEGK